LLNVAAAKLCIACAPPMRCMCAVTASKSRMSDDVCLQNVCNSVHIVHLFWCRVRATIRLHLPLPKGTCLWPEKRKRSLSIFTAMNYYESDE
jgi:hypothetical protein